MILRAISSLMATRDSLTLTMTFPPSVLMMVTLERIDDGDASADDKPQVLQMLLDFRASADFFDRVFFTGFSKC